MSNLIPTPRTDKLGRTIIRHMKDKLSSEPKNIALPSIAPQQDVIAAKRVGYIVRDHLAELPDFFIPISPTEYFVNAMSKISEDSPETLKTIERVMTTGSEHGRTAVAALLLDEVKLFQFGGGAIGQRPLWLRAEILKLWNSENVAEEAGQSGAINFRRQSTLAYIADNDCEKFGDVAWRGLAVFRLAFEATRARPVKGNLMDFIYWSGREKDIAKVIEIARERGTMDPSSIKFLMENTESGSVLREGML